MGDQAANSTLATISGHFHPGAWTKVDSPEENARSFNEWYDRYQRWTNICLRGFNMDDSMKWDMMVAAGGKDLHNVMKEAAIQMEAVTEQRKVPYRARQEAVPAGPNGNDPAPRPAQPEQPHIPGRPAIPVTGFDAGMQMIKDAITKHSNPVMQRCILMTEMPSTNYDSWSTCGIALKEQTKRCMYGAKYTWEEAALDALLYQCPDPHWRKKILAGKWDFQTALITASESSQPRKQVRASETRTAMAPSPTPGTKTP